MVNGDVSFGSSTSTYGEIYSAGNVDHQGTAYGSIYAEGNITGSPTMMNGAQKYDHNTIRTVIKNPINFSSFLTFLSDIQRAAQTGGVYLNDASKAGWRLIFSSSGTFTAQSCTKTNGDDVAKTSPTCGSATTYTVPANGAVYTGQTAIVSGTVNGRVTVASANNIVIANTISYAVSSDDVLGLNAQNDVVIAEYTPSTLAWRAAVLAINGTWKTWSQSGSHSTMNLTGSAATASGGSMTMFNTRNYLYDDTLQYLSPPWYPTVEDAYTITIFRELPAS